MIRSMTAYARRERAIEGGGLIWELRSVNHRYLEISLRLPDELRVLEARVREHVAARLKRGKLECNARLQPLTEGGASLALNKTLISDLAAAIAEVGRHLAQPAQVNALELLRWPGVVQTQETNPEHMYAEVLALLDDALSELVETRAREGVKLKGFIEQRCEGMSGQVARIRQRLPQAAAYIREKIQGQIAELAVQIEPARLEQELVLLAQRMDVGEELDRIEAHVQEVRRVLDQAEPVGRRLDFLMQELHREANTVGSKSADIETTRASVDMKLLIEQMREQVQNIE